MTAAANAAEGAAEKLTRSTGGTSATMQKMVVVLESLERDLTVLTHHVVSAEKAFDGLGGAASRSSSLMNNALMMRRNLMFQMADIGQGVPLLFQSPGYGLINLANQMTQVGQAYYGNGGMGAALKDMGGMLGGAASRLAPVAAVVAVLTTGFAAMTTEINRTAEQQVQLGDVLLATWQLGARAITGAMEPVVSWLGNLWDQISPGINFAMNALIGAFDLGFRNVGTIWSMLPNALGDVAFQAAQGTISGIEYLINESLKLLNSFIVEANKLLPEGFKIGELGKVDLGDLKNPFAGKDKGLSDQLGQNAADVRSKTMAGGYTADIGAQAQKNARARELEEIGEAATKAAEGLNVFDQMMRDVQPLLEGANDPLVELQSNMDKLGALLAAGEISWAQYGEAASRASMNAAAGIFDSVSQITGVLAGAFEDNKAIQAANIVVDTAAGVMKAWSQGGMFAAPMALAIGAAGAVQLASVLSAKPGSARVAGSSGGGGAAAQPAAPVAPAAVNDTSTSIIVYGDSIGRRCIEGLIKRINDLQRDGGGKLNLEFR
ncbi:hypothetical protein ASC68_13725 [Devosia sp. Root105]|nr:hypothetical protein ASC68_13725 [Devosia sp. Root105]